MDFSFTEEQKMIQKAAKDFAERELLHDVIERDEKSLFAINDSPPNKIIYVSCDPSTLQRDLGILSKSFFLTDIYPVDLFPQTNHIESVAILEKKNKESL